MTEVSAFSPTDAANLALGSINLTEGSTTVDQGNDIARALMGAISRQLGIINVSSSDVASATTTDLSTATGWFVRVTGTTTITGLGTVTAGQLRILRFAGALTFTHNATSLILPGAGNITTAANDCAWMLSLGSGNWFCAMYQKASGGIVGASLTVTNLTVTGTLTVG